MSEEAQAAASHASRGTQAQAAGGSPAPQDASTAVSHTNIAQMTATSTPPADNAKWRCEICTYENYPLSRKCTMCRAAKPVLGEDIFDLQEHASALPAPEACSVELVAERLKPLRISSPPAPASPPAPPLPPAAAPPAGPCSALANKWTCSVCTYENWPRAHRCAMCGGGGGHAGAGVGGGAGAGLPPPAPADSPTAHPAVRPARPTIGINDICNSVTLLDSSESNTVRRSKRPHKNIDWIWLQACLGVVENSAHCVEKYLAHGGDPGRALTHSEVSLLNRASAFDPGHTLVHLAIRFKRQEILATLLSGISGGGPGLKRSPSYIAPDIARGIRSHLAGCVRYKKGTFPCRYLNEFSTFSLPCEISELPAVIQEQLFSELLDRDVQETLERGDPPLVNWSRDLTVRLGSRLFALWNRSAGDCLPDAVCQAAYGVFDRDNSLRAALAGTLHHAARPFRTRWMQWERTQAQRLQYLPEESQLRAEWTRLVAAAPEPGTALHQLHVFVLAHVMRRPIIVYGVDVVNSFRGEALGYAGFQGIYLPLLWEASFCAKSPLCVAYTRGHFSALVPLEPCALRDHYICRSRQGEDEDCVFVPLTDCSGKLLPVHFLTMEEMCDAEGVVRGWVHATPVSAGGGAGAGVGAGGAVLAARVSLRPARPLLQAQMLEEWLNHYRRLAQQIQGPFPPRLQPAAAADYFSDPDTEDE